MGEETNSNVSWKEYLKEPLKPLNIDQAYQYAELLKPALKDGVLKVKELGAKAKGDMVGALEWFNSMSAAKQKSLMEMATGAAAMTKDAVALLTMTTAKECLSKAAQLTAAETLQKAQDLYASVMNAASTAPGQAITMANLKREEFLASGAVNAVMA